MNLQGKVSGFDFYKSLDLITDATRLTKTPDRLASFMLMVRKWRHLKMAKRSGCGYSGRLIKNAARGSFAIECRACPVPSVNLPSGWESAPAEHSWLYRLMLSQDANFRLKNRIRSSSEKDPSLQPGFGYFVSNDEYLAYLAKCILDDEYSKRFSVRMKTLPEPLQLAGNTVMLWAVPKFHLPTHKAECHGPYALNYLHGAGRTDGEGVERNWSWLNGAAPSTSQMGPGSRHDTLDDFIGFSNFRKTVDYGDNLLRSMVQAIPEAILHHQAFEAFTYGLTNEHSDKLAEWERDVRIWEMNKSKNKDPYLIEEEVVSVHKIECQLADEDRRQYSTKASNIVTPSALIISGLALEGT
ncbi:hypothetical protein H0H92_010664, partial [Tricholoma furcatifolium]